MTPIRIFTLIIVIVLSVTMMVAQTAYRDVVYLKNGGIVKGTIIETVPERSIKIETADGSVFVYQMSEIEKITKEKDAGQRSEPTSLFGSNTVSLPSKFSIFGGAALPLGDFAGSTEELDGFAKTGFTAGIQYVTGGQIGILINASYSSNPTDLKGEDPFYFNAYDIEPGSWTSILVLAGLKIGTTNTTGLNFFIAPVIGIDIGRSPEINGKINDYVYSSYYGVDIPITGTETFSAVTSTAFAYGVTAEVIINDQITFGARYIACKPKYDIDEKGSFSGSTYSYYYGTVSTVGTFTGTWHREQSTSLFLFYVGFAF